MRTWRLSATNTHLYPGARLAPIDSPKLREDLRAGDAITIEFADQGVAQGLAVRVLPQGWQLEVQPHTTARGTLVASRSWQVLWLPRVQGGEGMKIKARAA